MDKKDSIRLPYTGDLIDQLISLKINGYAPYENYDSFDRIIEIEKLRRDIIFEIRTKFLDGNIEVFENYRLEYGSRLKDIENQEVFDSEVFNKYIGPYEYFRSLDQISVHRLANIDRDSQLFSDLCTPNQQLDYLFDNLGYREPNEAQTLKDTLEYVQEICIQLCIRDIHSSFDIYSNIIGTKQKNSPRFPKIFKNVKGELIFNEYLNDFPNRTYADISYIIRRLISEGYIFHLPQIKYIEFLVENGYVPKSFLDYLKINGGLYKIDGCKAKGREVAFNKIEKNYNAIKN